jgi:2-oxoglutarate dehydrogenase complex dehydrogenase (E1) component-like enzyme
MEFESTLSGHNLAFLEALYETYKRDPSSVDPEWLPLLADLERGPKPAAQTSTSGEAEQIALQGLVDRLIEGYRLHGHTAAELDPLGLAARAPGAKRFSLEGGESLIPMLDLMHRALGEHGVDEVVIGMAHRGRLNVLANILGRTRARSSREFEDKTPSA